MRPSTISVIILLSLFPTLFAQDVNISYSHESGYYDAPFDLILIGFGSHPQIVYTLDGSNPETSENAFLANSPVTLTINPDDTTHRGRTPGVVVRAALTNGNQFIGEPQCRTYIFLENLKAQTYPGRNWPEEDYTGVNGHNIDYSMDPEVVSNPLYEDYIEQAFYDLPVISIATDVSNLFDPQTGIWVNSNGEGENYERECSFEIFNPDNTREFQINAGLRIKGGWSRINFNPKYSLRVLFKDEYGPNSLEYAFFGDEGAAEFEHIELRTEQNMNWTLDGNTVQYHTMLRDIFARDSQRDMGYQYIRSRYYHLFINGMYWGIYMTHERVNEDFAESYYGGDKDNYDVIKAGEVVDGSNMSWRNLWNFTNKDFADDSVYFAIMGRDETGKPARGSRIHVDIDNLIDYMILVFYTGNFDGPVSAWSGNITGANFIALTDRHDNSFGYKFFAVDFEYSMAVEAIYVGYGLYENRVTIPAMNTPSFNEFNPQWLHHKLTASDEYKMHFIDRAYFLLEENGILTPAIAADRMTVRKNQIDMAIIAESARWGDAQTGEGPAMTKQDWETEVSSLMDVFFPNRTDILIDQLLEAGLYSELVPPRITIGGNAPDGGIYFLSGIEQVVINNTNSQGVLYYTLDGTDPRAIGGSIGEHAIQAGTPNESFNLSHSAIIFARVKLGDSWSPLRKISILKPASEENFADLKVTELNYNPVNEIINGEEVDGSEFEFIEFKNTGTMPLNISGLHVDSAVQYTAPAHTILMPGEYFVIADKPADFYNLYGREASGNYTGNFSNGGELVLVEDSMRNEILSFRYDDDAPWPELADGYGYSMISVEINPTGDPDNPAYWTSSPGKKGNPFSDTTTITLDIPPELTENISVYPNPTSGILNIQTENLQYPFTLKIMNIMGGIVFEDISGENYIIDLDEHGISHGIYFLVIRSGQSLITRKIVYQ